MKVAQAAPAIPHLKLTIKSQSRKIFITAPELTLSKAKFELPSALIIALPPTERIRNINEQAVIL